ncbi:MAG: YncE family protein [Actinomycetes bacterium]
MQREDRARDEGRQAPARAWAAAAGLLAVLVLAGCGGDAGASSPRPAGGDDAAAPVGGGSADGSRANPPADDAKQNGRADAPGQLSAWTGPASAERHLQRVDRITGQLTPKSVVASGHGLVVAQNMIYTHTVSVFGSDGQLRKTINDAVTPSDFGYEKWTKPVKGGPVEAAFSPDGSSLWVSNYSMYGPGFTKPGDDVCNPDMGLDHSFLYRIDTKSLQISDIVQVGSVPKYVDATPDGKLVLVTNWCTWDLSLVRTGDRPEQVATVRLGRYPRGIAVSPDSRTAYVAVMGSSDIAVVDLRAALSGAGTGTVRWFKGVGAGPRHLNLSPDGKTLYATLNAAGKVAKVDTATGRVVATVTTGSQPRSAVLSPDGSALFVVNYASDTVSRVRTSDLKVLETLAVDHHPIGVTYDAKTKRVWVAAYGGSLTVFDDAVKAA